MNYFENAKKHFKTITRHRHEVIKNCFRAGIGLQGLFHDLSKYSPAEFIPGMLFFQGDRSPNESERETYGYSLNSDVSLTLLKYPLKKSCAKILLYSRSEQMKGGAISGRR